jgi:hypothetical protein
MPGRGMDDEMLGTLREAAVVAMMVEVVLLLL